MLTKLLESVETERGRWDKEEVAAAFAELLGLHYYLINARPDFVIAEKPSEHWRNGIETVI